MSKMTFHGNNNPTNFQTCDSIKNQVFQTCDNPYLFVVAVPAGHQMSGYVTVEEDQDEQGDEEEDDENEDEVDPAKREMIFLNVTR